MSRAYSDIAFTPAVRAVQSRMGSRGVYEPLDHTADRRDSLGDAEAEFIDARDGFYQATVSETGWPYVQFRGGPAGFLKVLDEKTVGYADFRGNVQYISVGNLQNNDRVSIILMDYAQRRRLKLLGRVRLVSEKDDPALVARLELPHYRAHVERAVIITVEAYDWNCPQHITPRFTEDEVEEAIRPLRQEIERLTAERARASAAAPSTEALGHGPLQLRVASVVEHTPRIRAYELRSRDGAPVPEVTAGAHLDVPVRLPGGVLTSRRYSIAAVPGRADAYEIGVLREDAGRGGSVAVHRSFTLGTELNCGLPGNDFALHDGPQPSVLIAGGIGITPIRSMAYALATSGRPFELHYAVRSRAEGAYLASLERDFAGSMSVYPADQGVMLDLRAVLGAAPPDAIFYVCGPAGLMAAVRETATTLGIAGERVRSEKFVNAAEAAAGTAFKVVLRRAGQELTVASDSTILEAVEAAGISWTAGCRSGTCGTCRAKVLEGIPEHRDSSLSAAEREQAGLMCICVSRAKSETLVLDI